MGLSVTSTQLPSPTTVSSAMDCTICVCIPFPQHSTWLRVGAEYMFTECTNVCALMGHCWNIFQLCLNSWNQGTAPGAQGTCHPEIVGGVETCEPEGRWWGHVWTVSSQRGCWLVAQEGKAWVSLGFPSLQYKGTEGKELQQHWVIVVSSMQIPLTLNLPVTWCQCTTTCGPVAVGANGSPLTGLWERRILFQPDRCGWRSNPRMGKDFCKAVSCRDCSFVLQKTDWPELIEGQIREKGFLGFAELL